ncbi:cytochrome c oxidase subunit II [Marinobacterium rhizophilum]|uniref:Cytochrome c oxidase subunit 2 n=1 Tax=Marinobacterium rhizophilum TaxID=420402 RepID=A0ABY5HFJ1_9GAMM|nr:cytochrome c oxidase subunit II [Marinobacterium rhizophilum]UTW11128.1 cytochrome c oxidase subunit II [Marinobacterium rhizophilum]
MIKRVWHLPWIGWLVSQPAIAAWEVNITQGATAIAREVYDLHMIIFWICVAIGVVVFGVMFWSIIHHRKSRGAQARNFHENTAVEILWTLIPFVILIAMAIPATATLIKMYDSTESDIDIQVTGYQWKWRYQYLGQDIDFFSSMSTPREQINNEAPKGEHYLLEVDNPVVLPVGKKVRFLFTANDVIHSWWVPDLSVKKDAIPGFINESWAIPEEVGTYRGQCTELCGRDHGFMPIVVEVKTQAEFDQWLADTRSAAEAQAASATEEWTLEQLMERGEEVYNTGCAACHQANGLGIPGAFPALAGSPMVTTDMDAHIDIVLNGKAGTAMQAFAAQLSAVDLAAVITYERNAWGNDTGDSVSPQRITELQQ